MRQLVLVAALLAVAVPAFAQEEAVDLTNKTCPVMVGEPVDPEIHIDYHGKRVYFCCESCMEDFKADPENYIGALPQFADGTGSVVGAAVASDESEHPAEDHEDHEDHAIGALHPAVVHFPVALTMAAALAALLSFAFAKGFFRNAWTFLIVLAALSAIPAFLLGEEAEELMGRMSDAREVAVHQHEEWGETALYVLLGVAGFHILTRFWPESRALRILALVAVLGAAGVVGYTGFLGGEVARPGHLDALLGSLKP